MGCTDTNPNRQEAVNRDVQRRLRKLETGLAGYWEITGVCTTAGSDPVDIVANEYSIPDQTFTITFSSIEGQRFQVQVSTDSGLNWTVAEDNVLAAVDPAISTEWESAVYEIDDFPVWFRVRRYPRVITPCTPPSATCPDIITG